MSGGRGSGVGGVGAAEQEDSLLRIADPRRARDQEDAVAQRRDSPVKSVQEKREELDSSQV